jgi:hypothetical protein
VFPGRLFVLVGYHIEVDANVTIAVALRFGQGSHTTGKVDEGAVVSQPKERTHLSSSTSSETTHLRNNTFRERNTLF